MAIAEALRLATLLDALSLGVLVERGGIGDGAEVVLANWALVGLFRLGVEPEALTGRAPADQLAASATGQRLLARLAVPARGDGEELDLPDGRVIECSSSPLNLDGGEPGRLWLFRDVTAAAAARRALQEHNRRLAALSALKTEFIAIVSHELRTPLTSIAAFTEMLSGEPEQPEEEFPEAIAAIARNTDRMLVLAQDLIQLAQLETAEVTVATTPVDLGELTREAAGTVVTAGTAAVTVRTDVSDGPLIPGDPPLLRQLLHTMVGTVASLPGTAAVKLTATADDTCWTITATTPTEEPVTPAQLLAMPLSVPGEADRRRSAALSILLARAIATRHGGALESRFDAGEVATMTVRLPLSGSRSPDQPGGTAGLAGPSGRTG